MIVDSNIILYSKFFIFGIFGEVEQFPPLKTNYKCLE